MRLVAVHAVAGGVVGDYTAELLAIVRAGFVRKSPHRLRTGLHRLWHATRYSLDGLRAGWGEAAFRQEASAALVLLPLSVWLGRGWTEVALLAGSVVLLMVVELLNSGIEAAIDRIGPEWHALSKRAKDMGSAAVLLSLLLCVGIWASAIYQRFLHG